ncbi:MAG: radical SAM protein [Clostridia bacterium]|nr:radical SAM protein [Clostridia bacterium]
MTERRHANVALFVPHAGCPHDFCFCKQRVIAGVTKELTPEDVTAACERALATLDDSATAQIAFFGGSFTAIDAAYRRSLLEAAQPFLQTGRFDGIRISTRPDCVDDAIAEELVAYGVTAVELGAQSMDDRVLMFSGRGHTAADTVRAAACIKRHGLSLGLQMMTGLPGDTDEGAMATAKALAVLSPDTVRVYPTVVLRGTALASAFEAGTYVPPTPEGTVALGARLLHFFEIEQHIPVIRFGLHDGEALRSDVLGGGYHPALRELCEGQLYVNTALSVLTHSGPKAKERAVTLSVSPRAVSKLTGHKGFAVAQLAKAGYTVQVKADNTVPLWDVRVILNGEE